MVGEPSAFLPKAAARKLSTSERSRWTLIKAGEIPHFRSAEDCFGDEPSKIGVPLGEPSGRIVDIDSPGPLNWRGRSCRQQPLCVSG